MPLTYKIKELEHLDDQILHAVQQIKVKLTLVLIQYIFYAHAHKQKDHTKKREFMLRFSEEPVKFLDQLIASQIHDYQTLQSDGAGSFEEERHSEYYYQVAHSPNTCECHLTYLRLCASPTQRLQ